MSRYGVAAGIPHCRGLWASSDLDTTSVCIHRMGFVFLPVPEGANPRQSGLWDGRADAQSKIRLLTVASWRLRSGSAPRSCQYIAEETWSPCALVRLNRACSLQPPHGALLALTCGLRFPSWCVCVWGGCLRPQGGSSLIFGFESFLRSLNK